LQQGQDVLLNLTPKPCFPGTKLLFSGGSALQAGKGVGFWQVCSVCPSHDGPYALYAGSDISVAPAWLDAWLEYG